MSVFEANAGIPVLQPHMFLGLNPSIKSNARYINDHKIIYPAGGVLVIHDFVQQEQKYIKLPDGNKVIGGIAMSPNKKLVAVSEHGDKPCIILYDLTTLKKKKVLGLPYESSVREFSSIAFTHDSKYVLAITGEPDWMMLQYNWIKGKVETSVKANNPPANPGPVVKVVPNPTDNSIVCIVGPGLFRLMASTEMAWRQFGFQKAENLPFSSVCWLSSEVVLAGTRDGRLVIVEEGDLRALYKASDTPVLDIKEDRAARIGQGVIGINLLQEGFKAEDNGENEVRCLKSFSKGFAYSCYSGVVHVYEKETAIRYRKRNVFTIKAGEIKDEPSQKMNQIQNIAVNPSQEALICTTRRMQIYITRLWEKDISQYPEINFDIMGLNLHHGPVVGLALCSWKQIMMTCGQLDQTVRIWDYTSKTVLMEKTYSESVYSLALHPTGLYSVMGFKDRLDYNLVLIDDLKCIRSFPIHSCNEARFSNSGHMFAAVNIFDINIYSTITFHVVFTFKGHTAKINTLCWSWNDLVLLSCGEDGSFCEWDLFEGKQTLQITTDTCHTDLAAAENGTVYCSSTDGILREIYYSQISKEFDLRQTSLDKVVLSRSDLMMFVAGDDGSILSLKWPWNKEVASLTFNMHNHRIVKMKLSYDDQTLITCSEDGTMCIWKVTRAEGKVIAMDPQFSYSNEVLIGKGELRDKINTIAELTVRIKELDQEQVIRTRDMETAHKEKVEELRTGYCTAIAELKEKNQELEMTQGIEIDEINTQIENTRIQHDEVMVQLETNYEGKLVVEFQKFQELNEAFDTWNEDFQKKYEELIEDKQVEIEKMIATYDLKVKEKDEKLKELLQELMQRNEKHEVNKNLIEDDTDKELVELRTVNEAQLQTEREANIKLRADTHMMKNRFVIAQREIDELRVKVTSLQKEQKQLKAVIKGIEKDINDLNLENTERDKLIEEKEIDIYDLKNKHQELEKFKNILDYKLEDTKEQLKPKDDEIRRKNEQLSEMHTEKDRILVQKTELEFNNHRLMDKLRGSKAALNNEIEKNNVMRSQLAVFVKCLQGAYDAIEQPNSLKKAVMKLYHHSNNLPGAVGDESKDPESGRYLVKKIEHFEMCLDTYKGLSNKLGKSAIKKILKLKLNNTWLITERNKLRQEVELMQNHVKDLKIVVGLDSKKMMPSEARSRLEAALKTREEIYNLYEEKKKVYNEEISSLQKKLEALRKQFEDSELPIQAVGSSSLEQLEASDQDDK